MKVEITAAKSVSVKIYGVRSLKMATTTEEMVRISAQQHEILKRVGNGSLDPANVRRALQVVIEGRLESVEEVKTNLIVNPDSSITLRLMVDHDQFIEDKVVTAREAGWWVNESIRTDRQIAYPGKPVKSGVEEVTIHLSRTVPSGKIWKTKKVASTLGASGLEFGFAELMALLPYRDELLKLGVRWIVAMGSRFRRSRGRECVACLGLGYRGVDLFWCEGDWGGDDWFGQASK